MTERLPEDLARALSVARPRLGAFSAVRYAAEVDSTNDIAIELAQAGASHGTAVLADAQRAGRGRRGRVWFSPPGAGVYLSAVVRPPAAMAAPLSLVTLAAGVATARAVAAATGLTSELKWPNDLVVGRPWRKLGGILCEAVGVGPSVDAIVLGVGLNLQHTAYPLDVAAATSIEDELGRAVDRPAVVVELLVAMREAIDELWAGGASSIRDAWRRAGRSGLGGAPVRWHDPHGEHRGLARDIDDDGALLVDSDGAVLRLVAGEVTWERVARD